MTETKTTKTDLLKKRVKESFMWDSCFNTLAEIRRANKKGGGKWWGDVKRNPKGHDPIDVVYGGRYFIEKQKSSFYHRCSGREEYIRWSVWGVRADGEIKIIHHGFDDREGAEKFCKALETGDIEEVMKKA